MYLRSTCFLSFAILSGCATKNVVLPTVQNHEQAYTGSPCVDGTITNIRESGCDLASVYTVPMTRTTKVECVERSRENPWTTYSFYMIPHGDSYVTDDMFLMCRDPMFVVTFIEQSSQSEETNGQQENEVGSQETQ